MNWLSKLFVNDSRLEVAESYIREHTALYRHYPIIEVCRHVKQFCHVSISDNEAVKIVQKIRNEKGMGPIKYYNMPGWKEEE